MKSDEVRCDELLQLASFMRIKPGLYGWFSLCRVCTVATVCSAIALAACKGGHRVCYGDIIEKNTIALPIDVSTTLGANRSNVVSGGILKRDVNVPVL
jgi:hypothetical protein